jgi:hypothetical protein
MRWFTGLLTCALGGTSLAVPIQQAPGAAATGLPRLAIYHQTTHDQQGNPVSVLPLLKEYNIALTHLYICSIHINHNGVPHLNDFPPAHPMFGVLWKEAELLRDAGVTVMGMVGGAAPGSFNRSTLDGDTASFEHYYAQLADVIVDFGLQGLDIDVEQPMSQAGIARLVRRLAADFGPGFVITLAPVASAMWEGQNLSGFSYGRLEREVGPLVHFYNLQFYNGFGSMRDAADFARVVARGFAADRLVAGQLTNPDNGYGAVAFDVLADTVAELGRRFGQIGGLVGWEYFNSSPGGPPRPWEWAGIMTSILRPLATFVRGKGGDGQYVSPRITEATARELEALWMASRRGDAALEPAVSGVDYMALVNA